jgi:hypothetical protein
LDIHFRRADATLTRLLDEGQVCTHPFVNGELALGHFKNRKLALTRLQRLPQLPMVTHRRVMQLIEHHQLFGTGIGLVDAHLLAATLHTPTSVLWTHDKRLASLTVRLNLSAGSSPSAQSAGAG